jgi:hypothetical protein
VKHKESLFLLDVLFILVFEKLFEELDPELLKFLSLCFYF